MCISHLSIFLFPPTGNKRSKYLWVGRVLHGARSTPSANMSVTERHLQELLLPADKCVHVRLLSRRRRRGWRPRGRRGPRRGTFEWGSWSGSRKRYATPAVTWAGAGGSSATVFSTKSSELSSFAAAKVLLSSQMERKLNMETVLYLPPEHLNLYSCGFAEKLLDSVPWKICVFFFSD